MNAELSQLKQEVAELWARYRKDAPLAVDDEGRRVLAEQNRTLETKRRALSDRSATLRHELEQHRRRASRLSPVVRVFGGFFGSLLTAALLGLVLPDVAALSVGLTTAQGAAILSGALLVLALSVSRADR
ncbi:MAG: hypothetical protein Q8L48_12355 [Archangium sp.]|nr:hypothetical protein [Archangium sp.]